jgi:hypothetical protein
VRANESENIEQGLDMAARSFLRQTTTVGAEGGTVRAGSVWFGLGG